VNSLVTELIASARENGVRIDETYAITYIRAREVLERQPNAKDAQQAVNHFQLLMSRFGRFMLPPEDYEKHCLDVNEDHTFDVTTPTGSFKVHGLKSHEEAVRALKLKQRSERQPVPFHLVEKCAHVYRPSDEYWPGGLEGIHGFLDRTGLSLAQIEAMTQEELQAYA
jgi:hypothetical protein